MTDKEKLEKLVAYLMRRMYAHNQMADIGSTGEIFDEKIENAKYEECKETLNFIDSMQEELTIPDIVDEHYWEMLGEEPVSEDLKEEIGKYCSNPENFITYIDVGFKQSPIEKDDIPLIIKAIEFGANWQKQQMMKNAIPCVVECDVYGMTVPKEAVKRAVDNTSAQVKDEVKLIIIKED